LERALGDGSGDVSSPGSRFWGLENFGNTCYANSVLQALYACAAFRERVLQYHGERAGRDPDEHLLAALAELFTSVRARARVGAGQAWAARTRGVR
jgi:ubiquitin carboxyl-terminal hydrolase 12/46